MWVVEHPEGTLVIDAGESARVAEPGYFPRWNPYFSRAVRFMVRPEQEVGPQLESLRRVARRRALGGAHPHAHGSCRRARPLPQRRDPGDDAPSYEGARGARGKLNGYLPHRWPEWFSPTLVDFPDEPFGPFPASRALTSAGDVRLLQTAGHTPGAHVGGAA